MALIAFFFSFFCRSAKRSCGLKYLNNWMVCYEIWWTHSRILIKTNFFCGTTCRSIPNSQGMILSLALLWFDLYNFNFRGVMLCWVKVKSEQVSLESFAENGESIDFPDIGWEIVPPLRCQNREESRLCWASFVCARCLKVDGSGSKWRSWRMGSHGRIWADWKQGTLQCSGTATMV